MRLGGIVKLGDVSETDEEDEEGRMKHEVERARERATLRHKNTGKWAKAMKGRGELDEDQRMAIGEMLDRGEKLRRRIQGEGNGDESAEDDDDSGEDGEDGVERIKASAFDELAKLREDGEDASEAAGQKGKSVFEMKFMKDAMARQKAQADKIADDFVKDLVGDIPGADSDGEVEHPPNTDTAVERIGGRVSFRPGNAVRSSCAACDNTLTRILADPEHCAVTRLRYIQRHTEVH